MATTTIETPEAEAGADGGTLVPATFWERNEDGILGAVGVVLFLAFWEASVAFGWVNPLFTSAPSRIVVMAVQLAGEAQFWDNMATSGTEFALGFALSVVVGIPLGILMGWYRRLNAFLDPFVSALYATPRIALIPLIVIWFGIGIGSKIAVIFLSTMFPILINTITGVRTVDRDFVKVARAYCANDRQLFMTVVLPASVPLLLTGVRLGLGHALIGVVVGEMYAATAGIGFMISVAGASFQTDRVMVGILIIAVAGMVMNSLLRALERRFEPWRRDNRG